MSANARPNHQRELVYCYQCNEEWYRDAHGIICPHCESDFVEIIEDRDDPRRFRSGLRDPPPDDTDEDDEHNHDHRHSHLPFGMMDSTSGTTFVRVDGPNFTYSSHRTTRPGADIPENEIFVNLFTNMLRNIVGDHHIPPTPGGDPEQQQHEGQGGRGLDQADRPDGGSGGRTEGPAEGFTFTARTVFPPPLNPRDASSPQAGSDPAVENLHTFLNALFGAGGATGHDGPSPLGPGLLARFLPIPGTGDYVYSQAELDRVISQLMEQHQGNAPPPASKEVIDSIPKVRVPEEIVNEGCDCAVCKEDLVLGEEVAKLPCKHLYHFECVSKWLESHDTCPVCRHPVTPEDKQAQQREEHRQRQANSNPLFSLFSPPRGSSDFSTPGASGTQEQSQPSSSSNTSTNTNTNMNMHANTNNPSSSNSGHSSSSGSGSTRSSFANLFRRR